MADITLKKKEAKIISLAITDEDGVVNVASATLTLVIKKNLSDTEAVITKNDTDFDKSDASNGNVSFPVSVEDTDRIGTFIGELKIYFSAANIDKSGSITIKIEEAVTD